jgi:hypothetical protein
MNRLAAVAAFAVVALFFLIGAAEPPIASGPLEIAVVVAPTSYGPVELLRQWHPDTFTCAATVIDASSHKLIVAPSVVVKPGEEIVTTKRAGAGLTVAVKGAVNATRGTELVTHQQSRFLLARANPRELQR